MQQCHGSSYQERSRLTTIENCGRRPLSYDHSVRSPTNQNDYYSTDDDEDDECHDHLHHQHHFPFQQQFYRRHQHHEFEQEQDQDSQRSDQNCRTDHDETSTFVSELTTPTVVSSSRFFLRRPAVEPEPSMSASELEKAIRKMERKLRDLAEKGKAVENNEKNQVISGVFLGGDGERDGEAMEDATEDEESSKPISDWEARVCDQNEWRGTDPNTRKDTSKGGKQEKCEQQKGEASAESRSKVSKDDSIDCSELPSARRRTAERSLSSSTLLRSCDRIHHDSSFYGCFPVMERPQESKFPPRPKRLLRVAPINTNQEDASNGDDSSEGEDRYRKKPLPGYTERGERIISPTTIPTFPVPSVLQCPSSSSSESSSSDAPPQESGIPPQQPLSNGVKHQQIKENVSSPRFSDTAHPNSSSRKKSSMRSRKGAVSPLSFSTPPLLSPSFSLQTATNKASDTTYREKKTTTTTVVTTTVTTVVTSSANPDEDTNDKNHESSNSNDESVAPEDIAIFQHHRAVNETAGESTEVRIAKARLAKRMIEKRIEERVKAAMGVRPLVTVVSSTSSTGPSNDEVGKGDTNPSLRRNHKGEATTTTPKVNSLVGTGDSSEIPLSMKKRQKELKQRRQQLERIRDRLAQSRMSKENLSSRSIRLTTPARTTVQ